MKEKSSPMKGVSSFSFCHLYAARCGAVLVPNQLLSTLFVILS